MPVVEKLYILKDEQKIVTQIIAEGVEKRHISTLCKELKRCCEHTFVCANFKDDKCYLIPAPNEIIKIASSKIARDNILKTSDNFFGRVYIKRDVNAYKKMLLINRLCNEQKLTKSVAKKNKISSIINYLELEGWDCTCDNENCTNAVYIKDVVKNLSLECPACLQQK